MTEHQLYPFKEFTEAELATLERFDAAPSRSGWPEAPLTPPGPIVPAHELVPQPSTETGTAAEWSTYYLARAYAHERLATHVLPRGLGLDADWTDYIDAVHQYVDAFSIAFLLRRVTDEVARELMSWLEAGDTPSEFTYQWLQEAGVDPRRIRMAMTHDEVRAERQRLQAQRQARRAELGCPSGEPS